MANVQLDVLDLDEPELQTFLKENQIETKVIANQGPSGWPLVEFRGTINHLREMILFFWADTDLWDFIKSQ